MRRLALPLVMLAVCLAANLWLPLWGNVTAPLCLLFFLLALRMPTPWPGLEGGVRRLANIAVILTAMGAGWRFSADGPADGEWNRGLLFLGLLIALLRSDGLREKGAQRWTWVVIAAAAYLGLTALDHQRVLEANRLRIDELTANLQLYRDPGDASMRGWVLDEIADLRTADRYWWVWPLVMVAIAVVGRPISERIMDRLARRAAARSKAAWFRRPTDLSSNRGGGA
jgi:hypothetical protein